MGMVVLQSYILVPRLKKTKTVLLRCNGYLNSIKLFRRKDLISRCHLHTQSMHCAEFEHSIKEIGVEFTLQTLRLILSTFDFGSYIGDRKLRCHLHNKGNHCPR